MLDVAEPATEQAKAGSTRVRKFDRPPPPHDWRWWVGGIGKTLIAAGLLMFGFVAYQLWGTGIETARAQNALESEFEELLAEVPADETPVVDPTPDVPTTDGVVEAETPSEPVAEPVTEPVTEPVVAAAFPPIEEGDPIARIEIPQIGVDNIVVAGVDKNDLKKGPGHYPGTPMPGQLGNSAIAGHRTTYGQPFYDVDKLQVGDEIVTTTLAGRYVYRVTGQEIVTPEDYQVIATVDTERATLTLTSCHPKWTTRERIIIYAALDPTLTTGPVGEALINYGREDAPVSDDPDPTNTVVAIEPADPAEPTNTTAIADPTEAADEPEPESAIPAPVDAEIADAFSGGWFSDPGANGQVALWGLALAAIGILSYLLSRRVRRDWVGLCVGIVPFVIVLYFFFQNVNRLLPPSL